MTAKLMQFTIRGEGPVAHERATMMGDKGNSNSASDAAQASDERLRETRLLTQLQQRRDTSIFDQIFKLFAPKLKSYLISLGSPQDEAESVVQDVMVTVWTKSHLFNADKASARTWLFTLVRNRYIDLKRANSRQVRAYDQYAESGVETSTSSDIQLNHTAGQEVSLLLEKLPKEQAEILLMAYVEGKSHREIAEQLQIPIGTTKSRVRLAFNRLRKIMESHDES